MNFALKSDCKGGVIRSWIVHHKRHRLFKMLQFPNPPKYPGKRCYFGVVEHNSWCLSCVVDVSFLTLTSVSHRQATTQFSPDQASFIPVFLSSRLIPSLAVQL